MAITTYATYSQRFFSKTSGGKELRQNWQTQAVKTKVVHKWQVEFGTYFLMKTVGE